MNGERTADYEFELPPELIAQEPLADRSASRLMVVRRDGGAIEHRRFADLVELIPAGDIVVLNTTRVLKARLLGTRQSGAPAEVLLLKPREGAENVWEAMVSPGGKLKPGRVVVIAPDFSVEILEVTERRTRLVRLHTPLDVAVALERHGHVPLPPYIARADRPDDEGRYQTVYAAESGSVAAPTAGLHFTPALLEALARRGVKRADVVLHVGAGTFKPVEVDDPSKHVMHEEWYAVSGEMADRINETRRTGGRVWAVGTTSVRTLESACVRDWHDGGLDGGLNDGLNSGLSSGLEGGVNRLRAGTGETRLFIRPPYEFQLVDRMITNFHLPRSTLLMLVSAFAGYDLVMRAYAEAKREGYRFYSYGDAMVII